MKKILYVLFMIPLSLGLSGCGFDDERVEYPVKSVLFTYQNYNRELVVGEGLRFKPGVVFAGLEKSDRDRVVNYVIDPTLVPAGKTLLPADYYTAEDDAKFVVKEGELKGYIKYELDSAKFVRDPKALTGEYVLPFKITSADADSVNAAKDYMVVSLKYLAKQFGYYTYTSRVTNTVTGEVTVQQNISNETNSVRELTTLAANRLLMHADPKNTFDPANSYMLYIIVAPRDADGVVIGSHDDSPIRITADGESTYDEATKTFTLRYKYTKEAVEYKVVDVLTFRNRIRDRQDAPNAHVYINEWEGF